MSILIVSHMIWAKMIVKRGPLLQEYPQVGQAGAAHYHAGDWDQPMILWVMKVFENDIRLGHLAQRSPWHLHSTGSFLRDFLHFAGEEHPGGRGH